MILEWNSEFPDIPKYEKFRGVCHSDIKEYVQKENPELLENFLEIERQIEILSKKGLEVIYSMRIVKLKTEKSQ